MTAIESLGKLANVVVEVEAILDRRIMTIEDVLALEEGSTIRMSRSAGENIDILVGGEVVGFGEVVIVENMICVRVTDFRERH
jgi:flagellar motor switch protein FliN/FliY